LKKELEKLNMEEGKIKYEEERRKRKEDLKKRNDIFHAKKHKERLERLRPLVEKEFVSKGITDVDLLEKTILLRAEAEDKEFRAKIQAIKIRGKLMSIPEDYNENLYKDEDLDKL